MTINNDVYSFDLLKNGTDLGEVTRNSSGSYIENLRRSNLIKIEGGRIFLTEKGEVAKKMGINKFLKLEKYEEKVMGWDKEKRERDIRFVKLAALLVIILAVLLIYVNSLLT